METELNLTNAEKRKILAWKKRLPRVYKYKHTFIETGKRTETGHKLYDYIIETDDGFSNLIVAKNVELK